MNRDRALLGAARSTALPIAVMYKNGTINSHRFADIILPGDANKTNDVLDAINTYKERTGSTPENVIPLTEMSIIPGLVVAERYGLPYLSDETVTLVRDKFRMKSAFKKQGIPTPNFAEFKTLEELRLLVSEMGFPCVVKPRNAGGSEGVRMLRNESEIEVCFDVLQQQSRTNKEVYNTEEAMFQVEEFVDAPYEVSVEVLNTPKGRTAVAVTDKYLSPPPYFVELGHVIPSRFSDNARIQQYALSACEALNLDRGMAHVELKVFENGDATVIEVNARPGGDNIMDLAERSTGLNLFQLHCQAFLSDTFDFKETVDISGVSTIAFMQARKGEISKVSAPRSFELESCIKSFRIWANVGDKSDKWINSHSRQGAIEYYWPQAEEAYDFEGCYTLAQELAEKYISVK